MSGLPQTQAPTPQGKRNEIFDHRTRRHLLVSGLWMTLCILVGVLTGHPVFWIELGFVILMIATLIFIMNAPLAEPGDDYRELRPGDDLFDALDPALLQRGIRVFTQREQPRNLGLPTANQGRVFINPFALKALSPAGQAWLVQVLYLREPYAKPRPYRLVFECMIGSFIPIALAFSFFQGKDQVIAFLLFMLSWAFVSLIVGENRRTDRLRPQRDWVKQYALTPERRLVTIEAIAFLRSRMEVSPSPFYNRNWVDLLAEWAEV